MNKKKHYIKQLPVIFMLLSGLITFSLNAHEGRHKNIVDKEGIAKAATNIIASAIEENKIDASWSGFKLLDVKTKNVDNTEEWLVTFQNTSVKKPKQIIYMFFSLDGKFLAMNYTGA